MKNPKMPHLNAIYFYLIAGVECKNIVLPTMSPFQGQKHQMFTLNFCSFFCIFFFQFFCSSPPLFSFAVILILSLIINDWKITWQAIIISFFSCFSSIFFYFPTPCGTSLVYLRKLLTIFCILIFNRRDINWKLYYSGV